LVLGLCGVALLGWTSLPKGDGLSTRFHLVSGRCLACSGQYLLKRLLLRL